MAPTKISKKLLKQLTTKAEAKYNGSCTTTAAELIVGSEFKMQVQVGLLTRHIQLLLVYWSKSG